MRFQRIYIIQIRIVITAFLLVSLNCLYSQDCRIFHKDKICLRESEKGFQLYGQSRSALFEIDSTFSYELTFYGKKDYILSVCTERGYGPVQFKIIEQKTGNVFYDNMEDEYNNSVGFTIDAPQKVWLEVTLLAEEVNPENFSDIRACVGVYIQWRKAEKLGF